MFTSNFVFNLFLIAGSLIWLVLLPITIGRIFKGRNKRTLLSVACSSVNALLWLLSVWLPFHRHGTLNTEHDNRLFWLGIAATYLPNLIDWWRTRQARVAQ